MRSIGLRALLLTLPLTLAACAPVLGVVGGPTESVVLPNGEVCGYAGGGATLAFDGQRLDWTCDVGETGPRGLFGAPTVVRETDVAWRIASTARRADGAGFELARIDLVDARVTRLDLESGESCAFAGEGATLALDGRRVHYTCGGDTVLVGAFAADDRGLLARRATLVRRGDAFELGREGLVRVRSLVLGPIDATAASAAASGAASAAASAATAGAAAAPSTSTAPASAADHAPLLGTTWALERIQLMDGTELVPADPASYTLLLGADGSVALLADCNRGAGRFDLDGERLSFAPFATTKMACPEGSIDQAFLFQLGSTASYGFDEGRLVLATAIDGSLLYFRPLP
jgi:heat shock protein HslJ